MSEQLEADQEAALRQLGAQADATENPSEFPVSVEAESQPATAEAEPKPEEQGKGQPPATPEKEPKSVSAEAGAEKAADPQSDKPETPYVKARKERERQESLLKGFQADKEAFQKQREEFERQRQEFDRQRQQPPERQYRSDEYESAAKRAEAAAKEVEDLDPEQAQQHIEAAKALRERADQARGAEFKAECMGAFRKEAEAAGVLDELKDPHSETGKQFAAALDANGIPWHPALMKAAVGVYRMAKELATARAEAASASALKTKVEELTKQLDEQVNLTSIPRTGPTRAASDTDRTDLSERDLRRLAAEHDEMAMA